jgi:hypothetical protein
MLIRKIDSITKSCSKSYFGKILKNSRKKFYKRRKNKNNYMAVKLLQRQKKFQTNDKLDILGYLNNLRKPISEDPTQRWIGSYNGRQIILNKFFRWLYNYDEPDHRKRDTPIPMKGIKQLPRKEKKEDNFKDHEIGLALLLNDDNKQKN